MNATNTTIAFVLLLLFMAYQCWYWYQYHKAMTYIYSQPNIDIEKLHAANDPEFSPILFGDIKEFDVCGKTLHEAIQEVERYYSNLILPSVRIFLTQKALASYISRGEHMQIILNGIKHMDQARARVLRKYSPEEVLAWRNQQKQYPVEEL